MGVESSRMTMSPSKLILEEKNRFPPVQLQALVKLLPRYREAVVAVHGGPRSNHDTLCWCFLLQWLALYSMGKRTKGRVCDQLFILTCNGS